MKPKEFFKNILSKIPKPKRDKHVDLKKLFKKIDENPELKQKKRLYKAIIYGLMSLKKGKYRRLTYYYFNNDKLAITVSKKYVMMPTKYADMDVIKDALIISHWLEEQPDSVAILIKIKNNNITQSDLIGMWTNSKLFKPFLFNKSKYIDIYTVVNKAIYSDYTIIIDDEPSTLTHKSPRFYAVVKYPSKDMMILFINKTE